MPKSVLGIIPAILSLDSATTAISGLIAGTIAALVSWVICRVTLRTQRRKALDDMIDKIVMVGIEYPYLEDDDFCSSWLKTDRTTEMAMRYGNYCCLVFNMLERLWLFQKGNSNRIEQVFYASEVIRRHKGWWKDDHNNLRGYPIEFHRYIYDIIGGITK